MVLKELLILITKNDEKSILLTIFKIRIIYTWFRTKDWLRLSTLRKARHPNNILAAGSRLRRKRGFESRRSGLKRAFGPCRLKGRR